MRVIYFNPHLNLNQIKVSNHGKALILGELLMMKLTTILFHRIAEKVPASMRMASSCQIVQGI